MREKHTTFIYKIQPTRRGFLEEMLSEEVEAMEAHRAYLGWLQEKTTVYLVGPCLDHAFGIVIFEAESLEAARALMAHDPAVTRGVMVPELHPFHIAFSHPLHA